jgi:hypothetical protein
MNWAQKYEKRRKGYRILVSVKHLKIFQFQDMHFMGTGPEGGRCRQKQKKKRL